MLLALMLASFSAGCSREAPEEIHTVSHYRQNADERHAMMKRCSDDPGSLGQTPNCVNARQASLLEDRTTLRDLPPLGLSDSEKNDERSSQKAN
jgi:hypothetical protein